MTRLCAATAVGFLLFGLSASSAFAKPSVRLIVPGSADAGAPVAVSYTTSGLRSGDRVVIQRQQGTARTWRTVVNLQRTPHGSSHLPGLPIGSYNVRIAALAGRGKLRAAQNRRLIVFGKVPFATLFGPPSTAWADGLVSPGAYTTPTRTFTYSLYMHAYPGQNITFATIGQNPCREVHFDFVPGVAASSEADYVGSSATLTVVQEALDPQSASAAYDEFGALDAKLELGKSWSFFTSGIGKAINFYANGYAVCFRNGPLTKPS